MGFEEIWNEYTSSEKDMFQKSVRRLLKQTFIIAKATMMRSSKRHLFCSAVRTIFSVPGIYRIRYCN